MLKFCPSCKTESETYDSWKCPYCKNCWRAYSARYRAAHKEVVKETTRRSWHKNKDKYNLERKLGGPTQYSEMLMAQHGVCKICHKEESSKRYKTLCVDHCHGTGQIRGLLCSNCNRALGLLKDDVVVLQSALDYLKEFKNE